MASNGNSTSKPRRRRGFSWIPTCFGGSVPLLDSGDSLSPGYRMDKATWFSWLRFRGKKIRTVPVDVAADDATPGDAPKEKPASEKKSFFKKFRKSPLRKKDKRGKSSCSSTDVTAEPHRLQVRHVASRCDARSEPAPLLYRMRDAGLTCTRSSHPGSPEPVRRTAPTAILRHPKESGPWKEWSRTIGHLHSCAGLPVLALALILTVLLGRFCATVCMAACFYFMSRFGVARNMAKNDASRKGYEQSDMSSKEHKKRVVLMGLLQREGRRPSATSTRQLQYSYQIESNQDVHRFQLHR